MASRVYTAFAASVLLVQSVFSQQYGCGYSNQIVAPVSLGSSLGYNPGGLVNSCGGNIGYSGINVDSSLGSVYPQGLEALAIAVGSSYGPSGIIVNSQDLEIGGQLIVSGKFPIIGTVSVSGDLPTAGQGQVQYNTVQGVGLSSGGCGYGLPTNVPNAGYGNVAVVGNNGQEVVGNVGLVGFGGCGCGL